MSFNADAFAEYVEAHRERFIQEFAELIAFPSVAAQNRSIPECANWLVERLKKLGAEVALHPIEDGSPVIVATIGSGERTLMVYNHYDVQPETPAELWDTDPFMLTIKDGVMYARGTSDDKGELLSRIQAVEAWLETQGELPLQVKFVYEGEEEIGSVHLEEWAEAHHDILQADGLLWEGGGYDEQGRIMMAEGCKGIAYFELRAKGPAYDLHSSLAPIIENPAWRLTWALASMKNEKDEITVDGYADHIRQIPEDIIKRIDALPFEAEKMRENYGISQWLNGLDDVSARRRYMLEPTMTICGFKSGYQDEGTKTIVPSTAMVKLDCRLVPDLTPELVQKLIRDHLDARGFDDIEVVMIAGEAPAMETGESAIQQAAIEASEKVFGKTPIILPWFAGSGPIHALSVTLGIPVISAGATWHPKARAHAPNENIFVDDYFKSIYFMATLMDAYADSDA